MTKRNFLLGKGERLIEDVVGVRGGGPKQHPYSFDEARTRLAPRIAQVVEAIDRLPDNACPDDKVVATVTLNPEYIAKSYYPDDLFSAVGIEPVGSRPKRITPEKRSRGRVPEETITTEFFVMGSRDAFRNWQRGLQGWLPASKQAQELATIEEVSAPSVADKIKGVIPRHGETVFEVVIHADALFGENRLLPMFRAYLKGLGLESPLTRRFYAGGLCFVELDAPAELAESIATFTPVRALRQMPKLRTLRPTIRTSSIPTQSLALPVEPALDSSIRAAIFDGGLPGNHALTAWARPIDATGIGSTDDEYLQHGTHVTSAFLFGHIDPTKPLPRPYAPVDHYRVLDNTPGQNPHELFEVLERIESVLVANHYDFINISLGPNLPIEDDDVHAWTAVLDERFSRGTTLAAIAVGNDGEGDAIRGLNRIQVPADSVNALAIGACDSPDAPWQRAAYSSIGPGRSPGLIKPDIVAFGGSLQRPFLVVSHTNSLAIDATGGTSFAAPSVLRMAAGIRAHIGPNLGTLAIRALLIHSAETTDLPIEEIGRGRLASTLESILVCGDDTVRVIYQGTISPARYIRAPIPFPTTAIPGTVRIESTLCYATAVDPHHPGNYTRAGLEIAFRPHDGKRKAPDKLHADTKSYFGKAQSGLSEDDLRRDSWKWENCLHASSSFQGRSLSNPVFDIHYNARLEGRNFAPDHELSYALVITIHAKKLTDLYDQVVRKYATQLEQLRPVIDIPIAV
ncbi:MAG: S8 family peptidase [Gammaproteobacteria bacterium]|nr:S8 family peptidase [Gammaproteobacteria bacterium]